MTTALVAELMVAGTVAVLRTAGEWKMLEKMGEKGWKALIPVYSEYLIFKKTWNVKMFWMSLLLSIAGIAFGTAMKEGVENLPMMMAAIATATSALVIDVKALHKVSKAFGHGLGYTVGLMLFPEIFHMVLGFGKSEFVEA